MKIATAAIALLLLAACAKTEPTTTTTVTNTVTQPQTNTAVPSLSGTQEQITGSWKIDASSVNDKRKIRRMNFGAYKAVSKDSYGILEETVESKNKDVSFKANWKYIGPGQITINIPGPYSKGGENYYIITNGKTMEIASGDGISIKMNRI